MEVLLLEQAGNRFAVDASWVVEIVEPAPVTPLPFAPAWVEGLTEIAGQVLVQIDFSHRLGLSSRAGTSSVLVLQVGGERLSVRVDQVFSKIELPPDRLTHRSSDAQLGEAAAFVNGEFAWEGQVVLCIGEAAFSLDALERVEEPEGDTPGQDLILATREEKTEDPIAADVTCLFFRTAGEIYGLRLSDVAEVVTGEALTPVPQAPVEVAGMLLLRGTPLLVLSLSALLGLPDDGPAASLAVVEHDGVRLALGVGPLLGIERFPVSSIQALPQFEPGLEGFVISRQQQMSGLIALPSLLDPERMALYGKFMANQAPTLSLQDRSKESASDNNIIRLLTFHAGNQHYAVPLDWVQRVAEAEEEAVETGADGQLAGVALIHGEVLPVADITGTLDQRPGSTPGSTPTYLVVNAEGATWALKVDKVERVVSLRDRDIEPVRADAGEWIGAVGKHEGQLLSIVQLNPLQRAA